MTKNRLEAFSDGVIAIIITIMVLELHPPHGTDWEAIREVVPNLLLYLLSFVFLGIYWNNHHHLLHAAKRINGAMLWANLHLLFWLSLIPFITAWWGEHFAPVTTAIYGVVLLLAALAYTLLQTLIIREHGPDSTLQAAIGSDTKAKMSLVAYLSAIPLAFVFEWASVALYVFVALVWIVPDRRIEARLREEAHSHGKEGE